MNSTRTTRVECARTKNIVGAIALLLYVNLLPYACRLYRGIDWAVQYFPDHAHFLSGMLFFGGFASLPALPLIAVFWLRKWLPATFAVACLVATGLLAAWHHNYDLAADAQAAIGLVFIPIYVALLTGLAAGITAVVESIIKSMSVRMREGGAHKAAKAVDVTPALIDAFHPTERQRRSALEIQKHEPIPLGQAQMIDD